MKKKILVFAGFYLPGFKAGGPVRSLDGMVSQLGEFYDFWIITSDRDLGDEKPYQEVLINHWQDVGHAKVFYVQRSSFGLRTIHRLVRECDPDFLYFNSFFDICFTIKPLLLWQIGFFSKKITTVLAPRGEFAEGALAIKPFRKKVYLFVAKIIGLSRGIKWQATSQHEAHDVKQKVGATADIRMASNLTSICEYIPNEGNNRVAGILRIVCVARISPNKNILEALKILSGVCCEVEFNLYGPIENLMYWRECEDVIKTLPENVKVSVHGEISHEKINGTLRKYDLFFLPTAGENFGHAIFEAFRAGMPVLISDLTPWRNLEEKGIGWDIGLEDENQFRKVIEKCAVMTEQKYCKIQRNIHEFVREYSNDDKAVADYQALFKADK